MLADGGRLDLGQSATEWINAFLDRPGIEGVPLTWQTATAAYGLVRLAHRDPADRLLIATALDLGCEFVPHDARIVQFAAGTGCAYGPKLTA